MSYRIPRGGPRLPGFPRPRRRTRWPVIIVGILMAGLAVAWYTGTLGSSHPSDKNGPSPQIAAFWLLPASAIEVRAACVDQTASSASSFAPDVLDELADAVASWPGPQAGGDGLPPRPALDLTLRTVSTHSSATDQQQLHVVVSEVPGLKPPPGVEDVDYAQDKQAWDEAANTRLDAWRRANRDATKNAPALRTLAGTLDRKTTSEISGCLAAAAASSPTTPTRRLLLASDLRENETRLPGSYGGSPVLVVQSCPRGTETGCAALAGTWSARLVAEGAGHVQTMRADAASAALNEWMESQ